MATDLVNIESDIERALTDFIREIFNDNSAGIYFSLGYWSATESRGEMGTEYIKADNDNPFDYNKERIVPMTIEQYDGEITALEGVFNAEYSLPLTFQIDVEDEEHFDLAMKAINEVKNKHRAQLRRLPVEIKDSTGNVTKTENFNMVMTTDNLTPSGDLEPIQGRTYAFGSLTFFFDISKDILYGNHVIIKMASYDTDGNISQAVRLFPVNPSMKRTNDPEAFQNFETTQIEQILKMSSYSVDFVLYMEDKEMFWNVLNYIVNMKEYETNEGVLHKPFKLIMEFHNSQYDGINPSTELVADGGTIAVKFEEDVVLLDGEPMFSIGEPMFLQLSLGKANVKKN